MTSDREAFLKIKGRLEGDVGRLLKLIEANTSITPFWAFLRMTFPIEESIGDLLYRKSSIINLICVLKEKLSLYNGKYKKFGELIALIYHHSLIHQYELRSLIIKNYVVSWHVGLFEKFPHLEVTPPQKVTNRNSVYLGKTRIYIKFNINQFYEDLIKLCDDQSANSTLGGKAGKRYEEWQSHPLTQAAKKELEILIGKKL